VGPVTLILGTNAFYWWQIGDSALSATARIAIADPQNEPHVSAITAWAIITKFRSGKAPGFAGNAADVSAFVAAQGFNRLPITMRHAEVASHLPLHHKDSMDRLLIAQAIVEDMTIVTADAVFSQLHDKASVVTGCAPPPSAPELPVFTGGAARTPAAAPSSQRQSTREAAHRAVRRPRHDRRHHPPFQPQRHHVTVPNRPPPLGRRGWSQGQHRCATDVGAGIGT